MVQRDTPVQSAKPKPGKKSLAQQSKFQATRKDVDKASAASNGLQQRCLNIFRDALQTDGQDSKTVQEVKGHLYNRDFATAFGHENYLKVYASRWSPSRALGYLQVLGDIHQLISQNREEETGVPKALDVVCLGGGAGAELVAFAGWCSQHMNKESRERLHLRLLDIANWDTVVKALHKCVITPPELSKYASAAAKEANSPLLPEAVFEVAFKQLDILSWPEEDLKATASSANLVTLMFTLNELYSTSLPTTQRLLTHLTIFMRPGSYLLVVDSPGSYSTVSINGTEKKYPMQWLLDYTLLGTGKKGVRDEDVKWEKAMSDESRWFRLPGGLRYPIELENMRYQIHLYRRLGEGTERG